MTTMFLLLTLTGPVGIDATPVAAVTAPLVCGVWGELWAPGPCCERPPRRFGGLLNMLRRRGGSSDCGCGGSDGMAPGESAPPAASLGTVPTMPSAAGLPDAGYRPLPTGAGTPVLQEEPPLIIQGN